jgi:hypothetical protein
MSYSYGDLCNFVLSQAQRTLGQSYIYQDLCENILPYQAQRGLVPLLHLQENVGVCPIKLKRDMFFYNEFITMYCANIDTQFFSYHKIYIAKNASLEHRRFLCDDCFGHFLVSITS